MWIIYLGVLFVLGACMSLLVAFIVETLIIYPGCLLKSRRRGPILVDPPPNVKTVKINKYVNIVTVDIDPALPTVLVFHGNMTDLWDSWQLSTYMANEWNVNLVRATYRGYGRSWDIPTQKRIQRDVDEIMNYLRYRTNLYIYGMSLGGAVAIDTAARYPHVGLIVCNTFTSIRDMAKTKGYLLPTFNTWDSVSSIQKIKSRVLFISGLQDEVIPPGMMQRLYDMCNTDKLMHRISGGTHNSTSGSYMYNLYIKQFIHRLT